MKLIYTFLYLHALAKAKIFAWISCNVPLPHEQFIICMGNLHMMHAEKEAYRNKSYLSHWSL